MWSKVVRKGEKWWTMTPEKHISKLAGLIAVPLFLSSDPKIAGNCPK